MDIQVTHPGKPRCELTSVAHLNHSNNLRDYAYKFNLITTKILMYNVIGKTITFDVMTLDDAMHTAKVMNEFVTIKGPDFEVCGVFGVDSVKDGKCPDGVAYDWNKASRIGQAKRTRV